MCELAHRPWRRGRLPKISHQYISEGKRLAKELTQNQWALGDLATVVIREGGSIADFAYEIGLEASTLRRYQTTAQVWPRSKRRTNLPFSVHAELNAYESPDAILNGLVATYERVTVDVVRAELGKVTTRSSYSGRVTAQEEAREVRSALRDPAVLREIATDPTFAPRLTRALLDPDTLLERQRADIKRHREADRGREGAARVTQPIDQAVEDAYFVDQFISVAERLERLNERNLKINQRQLDNVVRALRKIVTEIEVAAARLSLDIDLASIREGTRRLGG